MQISTLKNQNFEKLFRNPSNRTQVNIISLQKNLVPRMLSHRENALAPRFAMDVLLDPRRRGLDADYNEHLCQESNRETDKADGFAEDN
jgi:hypothetical protein